MDEAWKEIGARLLRSWNDTHCIENCRSHILNLSRLESRFNFINFFSLSCRLLQRKSMGVERNPIYPRGVLSSHRNGTSKAGDRFHAVLSRKVSARLEIFVVKA